MPTKFNDEKNCCAPADDRPLSFAERSLITYKSLIETNDILDSIAELLSGDCCKDSLSGAPECLDANIEANQYWAAVVRDRVRSLASVLGVKE